MEQKRVFNYHPGIRIDRIPASGVGGLLFTVATIVAFLAVPEIREFMLIGLLGGIPAAGLIYFWHNQTRW
jgi:hypothetical protein